MAFYDEVHATQKYRLLTRVKDMSGNEYIYLKGVSSTAAGSWVVYDEVGVTALIDTDVAATVTGGGFVAVAKAAVDASTEFGWYCIWGSCSAAAATVADNGEVFPTSTAGTADDTGTGGHQIINAKWRSTDSGALATVQLNYPWIGTDVA